MHADAFEVAKEYESINNFVKKRLKSSLNAPFMALLVIPEIKISDKGVFDANSFHFIQKCTQ